MSDTKISALPDGGAVQSTDEFVAARSGTNVKIAGSAIGSGGSSPVLAATKSLSSAEILALGETPVTLIEGIPGKLITPLLAMAVYTFGTSIYAADSGSRFFIGPDYASSGWAAFSAGVWQSDAFDSAETFDIAANWQSNEQAVSIMDGQPLRLDNSSPVHDGDGTSHVTVLYYLLSV